METHNQRNQWRMWMDGKKNPTNREKYFILLMDSLFLPPDSSSSSVCLNRKRWLCFRRHWAVLLPYG